MKTKIKIKRNKKSFLGSILILGEIDKKSKKELERLKKDQFSKTFPLEIEFFNENKVKIEIPYLLFKK